MRLTTPERRQTLILGVLFLQFVVLLACVAAFWFPSVFPAPSRPGTIDRADYAWLLLLVPPLLLARRALQGRFWSHTPLDFPLLALLLLALLSTEIAPYGTRGPLMLARPLLGVALLWFLTDAIRDLRRLDGPLWLMLALALLVGAAALVSTQWVKSDAFTAIIERLPALDLWFAPGGFNPNEIAGAITWLAPLAAGMMFYRWRGQTRWLWRGLAAVAFVMLVTALFLGQSRSGLIGLMVALVTLAFMPGPLLRPRMAAMTLAVGTIALLEVLLVAGILNPDATRLVRAARGAGSVEQRVTIWSASLKMVGDHPLTGVGLDRFRSPPVRADYPIVWRNRTLNMPHAHNAVLQIATDMGIPGVLVFVWLNGTAIYMVWVTWRTGGQMARLVAVMTGTSLLAYYVYSLADAIPLWDRFAFIYWLVLGLIAGQYVLVRESTLAANTNLSDR